MRIGVFSKRLLKRIKVLALCSVAPLIRSTTAVSNNKIVFSSFSGHGYSCNPKYILEELIRNDLKADYVWLIDGRSDDMPSCVRQVQYASIAALKELASARIWVDNTRGEKCIRKKKGQFYIQTWHALSGGVKKVEKDASKSLSRFYLNVAKKDGADTDIMIADNDFCEQLFLSSFWFEGPVIRCGMPRNRPFFEDRYYYSDLVRSKLGINQDKRICLYAPTFRNKKNQEVYCFDYNACLEALSERFGGQYSLVLRLHPNLAGYIELDSKDNVIDASLYPDTQELLAAADVLITDYSSVSDDFSLTRRPCFIYAPDRLEYETSERGFYFSLNERPFPVAENITDLIKNITCFSEERYKESISRFFSEIGLKDYGEGAGTVAAIIASELENGYTGHHKTNNEEPASLAIGLKDEN